MEIRCISFQQENKKKIKKNKNNKASVKCPKDETWKQDAFGWNETNRQQPQQNEIEKKTKKTKKKSSYKYTVVHYYYKYTISTRFNS